ncbi:hypothetical protein A9G34_02065 [Gilliamella sp. Choc4-2]|uniref:hypothetical protein n=1 Tax=Gilliamella sp. Choc4-2 TaxID=3120237 RepID=UPI00080E8754|nr:hypothetical protein [Gilliamella apicola]OCG44196.1 hypothetical protein A9G34_02065 [Gilliamella apicola]
MSQKIYLGPTMSGQGITITTGSIFNGKFPSEIEQRQQTDANFAALFVDVDEVAEARTGIRNGNTFLAECYKNVYQNYISSKELINGILSRR